MDSPSQGSAKDILFFQIRRDTVSLYKRYLTALEDIRIEHEDMLNKLRRVLPAQYHKDLLACDYFSDAKFANFRKRILDSGNEAVRGLEDQLNQFAVDFQSH